MQRGLLYHDIFEEFIRTGGNSSAELRTISERHFTDQSISPHLQILWRPRLWSIIDNFIKWHKRTLHIRYQKFHRNRSKSQVQRFRFHNQWAG